MVNCFYEAQWPKDNLYINCFVHEVMNFRYHWHPDDFELNILLSGQQYFCRGKESHLLQEGDIVLVDPNIGHASYGQTHNTLAMVLHFSSSAIKQLSPKKDNTLSFTNCCSNLENRNSPNYKSIRSIAAQLILSLSAGGPYAQYTAKACTEMLISNLCNHFKPIHVSTVPEVDENTQKAMRTVMSYIEQRFSEKISLEDIAEITQYNRTYISTLFHKSVGIGFYEYLTRVRLQNALKDLVMTEKNLTEIAVSNGFADLKSFNNRFREMLQCLPSEYRKNVLLTPTLKGYDARKYIPIDNPVIMEKLKGYSFN